eukprot:12867196-Ditylum_brightwellii.AAC.1
MTRGTAQSFFPAPGILISYNMKRSFQAYLCESAKLGTPIHPIIPVPGFITLSFFTPLTCNEESPFHISPYNIISAMPQSTTNSKPAFFQVGKVIKEIKIQAMTIPSYSSLAAQFGRRRLHYFVAIITKTGGASFLSTVITPEGTTKLTHYEYNLETHKVNLIDIDIPDDDTEDGLEGFEDIQNPFSSMT